MRRQPGGQRGPTGLGGVLLLLVVAALGCASGPDEEDSIVQRFSKDAEGLALQGHDPVSYFSEGGPAPGSPGIVTEWQGASFRFVSEENRERFRADPERHAPRFGGHCAFGMSMNQAVPADPMAWTVHDGKLYLNASAAVRFVWRVLPGVVTRAERHWTRMQPQ